MLTSAFISYCGPFARNYRDELITKWIDRVRELGIPIQDDFHPI